MMYKATILLLTAGLMTPETVPENLPTPIPDPADRASELIRALAADLDDVLAQLQEIVTLVNIIPFGQSEARIAAGIRVKLEKSGKPIGPYDILIAASAVANKCTLITHNRNEFSRVPGLKLEDWY